MENLTYPIPDNEFQRLQALHEYDLLDTPPEEEFDRLTEIAERELDVDVAAITFLDDDRQFLKSATGTEITETPRESSFCTYTILSEELTIIPDSRKDDRLDENHLCLEGNEVRAYAGAPLVTEDGNQLGSFCLMSFQPRKFDSDELDLLKLLRDQTLALINSRHHEKQLRKLAHYDPITGFLKRQLFKEELQETLWNVSDPGHTIAIGHLDLTRFDRVTDTLGYSAMDKVLGTVADRIKSLMPDSSLKTRVRGDEFLLSLTDNPSRKQIKTTFRQLLDALHEPIMIGDESFLFSARVGISLFPETGQTVETLLRQANVALQETSAERTSAIKFYLSDMYTKTSTSKNIEQDFIEALEENQFTLNYQPKVSLEEQNVVGMEALVRWNHPERGFVPPPTIISLAETLGEMSALGRNVMQEACNQVHQWNKNYGTELDVGVNVSALEIQQGQSFIQNVREIIDETDINPDRLIIEITETEVMDDLEFTVNLLQTLKDLSVNVAIDDFGTGQSSLQYLAEFPDPILKIDRAFIDGVPQDKTKDAIVKTTVTMSNEMGIKTIAEGVERQEEQDYLKKTGCDYYQGYHFSKPVESEIFEDRFLRDSIN